MCRQVAKIYLRGLWNKILAVGRAVICSWKKLGKCPQQLGTCFRALTIRTNVVLLAQECGKGWAQGHNCLQAKFSGQILKPKRQFWDIVLLFSSKNRCVSSTGFWNLRNLAFSWKRPNLPTSKACFLSSPWHHLERERERERERHFKLLRQSSFLTQCLSVCRSDYFAAKLHMWKRS